MNRRYVIYHVDDFIMLEEISQCDEKNVDDLYR